MTAWEVSGRDYGRTPAIHAAELVRRIQQKQDFTLLDVPKKEEVEAGRLPNSVHIFLGELPPKLDQVPKDQPVTTFCGSGQRAGNYCSQYFSRLKSAICSYRAL